MGNRRYDFAVRDIAFASGTHVMAILNVTPDSFFEDSRAKGIDEAIVRVGVALADGAEIIDIGGQSTRPNAVRIGESEELKRIIPYIEAIRAEYPSALLSVDTFYASVAKASLRAGADMINDVSCLSDPDMASTVAKSGAAIAVMHDRRRSDPSSELFADKLAGLSAAVGKLLSAGVEKRRVLLDGGIGFNFSAQEDMALLNGYERLMDELSEYPFMLGTSRKSMFGGRVEDRLPATVSTTQLAAREGVLFVRVHDVKENRRAIDEATQS